MCGPLCEAVLDWPGSAADLDDLARSNLLLVPLDRRGQWYRYHHLFRDMLLAEAERLESGLIPVLRRRAAAWCLRNNLPEEALEYSMAAGDVDTVARLVEELWLPTYRRARITTLQRWFRWLDDRGGFEDHPRAAAYAALLAMTTGRAADAEQMAYAVDRWRSQDVTRAGNHLIEGLAAALRALMCRHGVEQMHADADEAARQFAAAGIVRPMTGLLQGIAHILSGDLDSADVVLDEAVRAGQEIGTPDTIAQMLCERSLVAMARNQWNQAEALAGQARSLLDQAGLEDATVCAAQARVALHRGDVPAARRELASAQRLRSLLTYAQPHVAVQTRIELIRAHIALADISGARTLMREVDDVLKLRPGLGILVGEAGALRARLGRVRGSAVPGASALTAAELRLLPLLSTHLSFPEMAAEQFLSRHTIKTQAISIYRKLGVSSRNQAVTRARELGLLEG
jgi:LuxR family maltose regulon positive regulatory protein